MTAEKDIKSTIKCKNNVKEWKQEIKYKRSQMKSREK